MRTEGVSSMELYNLSLAPGLYGDWRGFINSSIPSYWAHTSSTSFLVSYLYNIFVSRIHFIIRWPYKEHTNFWLGSCIYVNKWILYSIFLGYKLHKPPIINFTLIIFKSIFCALITPLTWNNWYLEKATKMWIIALTKYQIQFKQKR